MSTYEEEHGLGAARRAAATARAVPTLQQALTDFMATSAVGSTPVGNRTLAEQMLGQMLGPGGGNVESVLQDMVSAIDVLAGAKGEAKGGVDDAFLDGLERVDLKKLELHAACPICTNEYHQDPHPLVVELPCSGNHVFDLECIGPWLKTNKTCPMCRADVTQRKREVLVDSEDEEDDWEMYG